MQDNVRLDARCLVCYKRLLVVVENLRRNKLSLHIDLYHLCHAGTPRTSPGTYYCQHLKTDCFQQIFQHTYSTHQTYDPPNGCQIACSKSFFRPGQRLKNISRKLSSNGQ